MPSLSVQMTSLRDDVIALYCDYIPHEIKFVFFEAGDDIVLG